MPAHTAPTSIAARTMTAMCSGAGSDDRAADDGRGDSAASRYWPSTPMLNRFIRKPMATARADR